MIAMNRISVLYGMLALGACLVCVSCGNVWKSRDRKEPVVTVERKVRYFSKIEVEYPCDVIFAQSESLYVSVSGTRDAVNGIVTVHDGDRLVIRPKMLPGMLLPARLSSVANIYVSSPDLTDVMFKTAGSFRVTGPLDTDTLRVRLTGSGDVWFGRIVCDALSVELEGSGNVSIDSVRGVSSYVSLLGAGNVKVRQYKFADSRLRLMGVGDMDATFEDCNRVECELMGVGNMNLRGTVRSLSQNKKGTGSINTDELRFSH